MINKKKNYISKAAYSVLVYGMYLVICHLAFSILYSQYLMSIQPTIFIKTFSGLFEYTLMSILLIVAGSFLIEFGTKEIKKRER